MGAMRPLLPRAPPKVVPGAKRAPVIAPHRRLIRIAYATRRSRAGLQYVAPSELGCCSTDLSVRQGRRFGEQQAPLRVIFRERKIALPQLTASRLVPAVTDFDGLRV